MLQSMREGVKSPFMKFFLLFLAAGFALWGIGDVGSGLFAGSNKAIEAGNRSATAIDVANEFERVRRTAGGGISTGDAVQYGLLDEVVGTTARSVLFEAEADRLGLVTTPAMQKTAIQAEPSFKNSVGAFSELAFRRAIGQSGFTEQSYLERLNSVLLQEQLLKAVSGAGRFPAALLDTISQYQLEQRTASWIEFKAQPEQIETPDDTALASYYDAQKSTYDAPVMRNVDVLFLSPAQIASSLSIDEETLQQAYQDRLDEFTTPETRAVKQMVFSDEDTAKAAAKRLADGEAFNVVAADVLNWSEEDTDLGLVQKNDLATGLNDAVFAAALGDVVGPVETAFGFHLATIEAINTTEQVEFADVKTSISETLAEEQAIDMIYDLVATLEDAIGSGASLDEAAAANAITVTSITGIDANGRDIDGNPFGSDDEAAQLLASDSLFLTQLFETEIDEISPVIETAGDSFFILQPIAEAEARERDLSEVKQRVIIDWKAEQAIKKAREIAENTQNAPDGFATAAPSAPFTRTGAGIDSDFARLIANASFETAPTQTILVDTGAGTILLRTETIIAASADDVQEQSQQIAASFDELTQTDMNTAINIRLADIHNLDVNVDIVRQILLGQADVQ